ncbi:MAG: xanthine dehydrogenase family protein molybdopterin-binding subunit [Anaerolineae bacterium]|nr:xanthine dehydrogenase family protein molybdopterin-binding subunit [Anaerolineae bacterium]
MSKDKTVVIGQNIKRIDALGKVTGETPYPGDINLDGQLWMKLRFSDRAHARVVSIDNHAAEALPGVVRIFTAKDVPQNEYGLVTKDQPVLCGPGSNSQVPGADIVRCYMDCVAVVVAETEAIAAEAVKLIDVIYEDLPPVFDPEAAMQEGAPQLHTNHPQNILCHYRIRKGDMAAGWAQAEVVVEGEYHTGYQEHAYLQPEAGLGYIDEQGRVTVIVAGQWVHEDQEQIYHALGLQPEQVRVIYPAIGGAFGGREDMSVQIVLALAVHYLRRPVKIQWSREESILYHHKRHPVTIRAKWGATRDGKVVAVEATAIGDAGPYNYTTTKVMGNCNLTVTGPYEIPNIHLDTYGVLTNNIPTGAFRGFGAPQGALAAEGQMNKLAEVLGIDPVELRARNVFQEGSILSVGTPLPKGVSMPEVVEACARESFWEQNENGWKSRPTEQPRNPALRRGIGFAAGFKNIGYSFGFPEQSWATVELHGKTEIEQVIVRQAGAEVGQGSHTAFSQMTADAVGVPFEKVKLIGHDTAETLTSGSASASRLTFMAGNAIRGAAAKALAMWANEERPAIATYQYRPPPTTPYDPETGRSEPNFAYGYVAQAVEVEVDIETGHIHLLRVISANDVGQVVNPLLVQGQIEGAVVQAQGYAVMENLISVEGKIRNPYLSTYLIPTILDVPTTVKSVILEYADPIGPWGARGMAEMPFLPLAPAIAAAVHDATGVWIDQIPLTPERVVAALRQQGIGVL